MDHSASPAARQLGGPDARAPGLRRRALLEVGALACAGATAQTAPLPRRIALLSVTAAAPTEASRKSFAAGLADAGWLEGRDYTWVVRHADNQPARLESLAAELLAAQPALIIAPGQAATAAMRQDSTVPVLGMGDLVEAGLAKSLQQPGGRATGVSILWEPLNFKRLEILAQVIPRGGRVLLLAEQSMRQRVDYLGELGAAGRQMGLEVQSRFAVDARQFEAAFEHAARERMAGVSQLNSPLLWGMRQVSFAAALRQRLPAIYQWAEAAREGGLIGYGPRNELMRRQLMRIAVRVLQGESPARIPIEQPTDIHLTLNQSVAAQIGLKFPSSLLARADEVVG